MNVSRRCTYCSADWPDSKLYNKCPECEEETTRIKDIEPMDDDEALYRKSQAEFERFYERWDSERDSKRLEPTPAENRLYRPRNR